MTEEKEMVTNQVLEQSSIFTGVWQWLILDHLHLNYRNANEVLFALWAARMGYSYTSRDLLLFQKYFFLLLPWHLAVTCSQVFGLERQYKRQSGFPGSETGVHCLKFWQRKKGRKKSSQQLFTIRASAVLFHGSCPVSHVSDELI